jgi:hypothetical protein
MSKRDITDQEHKRNVQDIARKATSGKRFARTLFIGLAIVFVTLVAIFFLTDMRAE